MNLLKRFKENIKKQNLIHKSDTIVLTVSGGADSMCMLHLFSAIQKEWSLKLFVVHINHGLRGKDSDSDAVFVEQESQKLNIPFIKQNISISQKTGIEEAAREKRYEILKKICIDVKARVCATAHHADDNIETILMCLIRGTGIKGMMGIPQSRLLSKEKNTMLIRPLLPFFRTEIENYLREQNIPFCHDITNEKTVFFRNRIRKELIPLLTTYNPCVKEHILNTSSILTNEHAAFDEILESIYSQIITKSDEKPGDIAIDLRRYFVYNVLLRRKILHNVLGTNASFKHIEIIQNLLSKDKNFSVDIPGEMVVKRQYHILSITRKSNSLDISDKKYPLKLPGTTNVGDKCFETTIVTCHKKFHYTDLSHAFLDYTKLENKCLFFRFWQNGDTFQPFGMKGRKKLQDYFSDEKIPLEKRGMIPLLVANDEIIWTSGYRIAEPYKVSDDTTDVLMMKITS